MITWRKGYRSVGNPPHSTVEVEEGIIERTEYETLLRAIEILAKGLGMNPEHLAEVRALGKVEPKPTPKRYQDRPHPSACERYDPIMMCDCWPTRMEAEIAEWRVRG